MAGKFEEGKASRDREIIQSMAEQGCSVDLMAQVIGLYVDEIQQRLTRKET